MKTTTETEPVTEHALAKRVFESTNDVDAGVEPLVRKLKRHGFIRELERKHARMLLELAKRLRRNQTFIRANASLMSIAEAGGEVSVSSHAGQIGLAATLTSDDIARMMRETLFNGIQIAKATRADLLAHAEHLEKQAAGHVRNARVVRYLADMLSDDHADTVERMFLRHTSDADAQPPVASAPLVIECAP